MANIFLSYNRQSKSVARTLANDLEALGHTVWFDQELSGGQVWWDQILAMIRDCDVFVFVLAPKSLTSTACNREFGYAADLGKPILPILVSAEVSTNLLPEALSQIQFVDYKKQDRDAAFRLARAIAAVPPPAPLPNPLPSPPEVPVSYLGSLAEQVETTSTLSFEQQSTLVVDLKKCLRDPETTSDTRILLERLRKRRDLLASIADEIDEVLAIMSPALVPPGHSGPASISPAAPVRKAPQEKRQPVGALTEAQRTADQNTAVETPRTYSSSQMLAYWLILIVSIVISLSCIPFAMMFGSETRHDADLRLIIKSISLAFYASTFIVFYIGYRRTSRRDSWRYGLWLGMLSSIAMIVFSLILSRSASFDEIWLAWLIAGVLFVLLSIMGLRNEKRRP